MPQRHKDSKVHQELLYKIYNLGVTWSLGVLVAKKSEILKSKFKSEIENPQSEILFEILLKQLKHSLILIRPAAGFHEGMRFDRVYCKLPVFLPKLYQSLYQSHNILEMNVIIYHAVTDKQGIF